MNFKTNHKSDEDKLAVSATAFQRGRSGGLVCVVLFLTLVAVIESQTSSSAPVPPNTSAAAEPAPTPGGALSPQSDGATTQEPPSGQQPADDQSAVFVFKTQVREVILHATVVDAQRRLVTNLDRPAFTAFENGVPQATTSFHRDDVPVAMGIVIDNSGSMREKRDKVNQAVLNLIRAHGPGDEIFVVNFSQDSYLDQDFTSDIDLLQQALRKVTMQGSTALYDAIVGSAVHLKNNTR